MFVVDASVVVHALIDDDGGDASDLIISGDTVAPFIVDLEVLNSLRKGVRIGMISEAIAREAFADFHTFPIQRYRHEMLLSRIWQLRQNITPYDAAYVALAEHLSVPLLTRDLRLYRSASHTATIQYID